MKSPKPIKFSRSKDLINQAIYLLISGKIINYQYAHAQKQIIPVGTNGL